MSQPSSEPGTEETPAKKQKKKLAGLIDITRANNVAISLKAFKEFTFGEICEILSTLDPERRVTGDRIAFLASVLPSDVELKQVSSYKVRRSESRRSRGA